MDLQDRIHALCLPYRDCAAAIDGARVLAKITGDAQTIHYACGSWQVFPLGQEPNEGWTRVGGIYTSDEPRSHIGQDAGLTPERAAERGLLAPINFAQLRAEYGRVLVGGWGSPIND
jgi:hypothetical protein